MRKSRYTEEQIIGFIKQLEAGMTAAEVCCRGASAPPLCTSGARSSVAWTPATPSGCAGVLGAENTKLKKLLAEQMLNNEALKAAFGAKR